MSQSDATASAQHLIQETARKDSKFEETDVKFRREIEDEFEGAKEELEPSRANEVAFLHAAYQGDLGAIQKYYGENPQLIKATDKVGRTALTQAAEKGHLEIVKFLHDKQPDSIKAVTQSNATALFRAVLYGQLEVVKLLHSWNPELVKIRTRDGYTALQAAAREGYFDLVKFLYQSFPEAVSLKDTEAGWFPLSEAVLDGNPEVVKFLIDKYPEALTWNTSDGDTTLIIAAGNGHMEVVDILLQHNSTPEFLHAVDEDIKGTAFICAANHGHLDIMRRLFKQDPTVVEDKSHVGAEAFCWAIVGGHLDAVKCITDEMDSSAPTKSYTKNHGTALMLAVSCNKLDIAKYFCETFPDLIAHQDREGETALSVAALKGRAEMAKYLIGLNPALIRMANNDGDIPLMIAGREGHVETAKVLYEADRDSLRLTNDDAQTAIHTAANEWQYDCVKYFMDEGDKETVKEVVAMQDFDGMTIAMHAAQAGWLDIIKALEAISKENVLKGSSLQRTPFFYAAQYGQMEVLEYLYNLKPGEVFAVDVFDRSPHIWVIFGGCPTKAALKFLLEKNSAPANQQRKDWSLLSYAAANGDLEIIKLVYDAYPAALHMKSKDDGEIPLMAAAGRGRLEAVKFLYECDPATIEVVDNKRNMAIAHAAKKEQGKGVLAFLRKEMKISLADLIQKSGPETVAAFCKNQTLNENDWKCLFEPARQACENAIKISDDALVTSIEACWLLTYEYSQFYESLVEAGGLDVLEKLLTALRKHIDDLPEKADASDSPVKAKQVQLAVLNVLGNLSEVASLRPKFSSAQLAKELSMALKIEVSKGNGDGSDDAMGRDKKEKKEDETSGDAKEQGETNKVVENEDMCGQCDVDEDDCVNCFNSEADDDDEDSPAFEAARIFANLFCNIDSCLLPEKEKLTQELSNQVEMWNAANARVKKYSITSLSPFASMLHHSAPTSVRRYALWLLLALTKENAYEYVEKMEKAGIIEPRGDPIVAKCDNLDDLIAKEIAEQLSKEVMDHRNKLSDSYGLRMKLSFK